MFNVKIICPLLSIFSSSAPTQLPTAATQGPASSPAQLNTIDNPKKKDRGGGSRVEGQHVFVCICACACLSVYMYLCVCVCNLSNEDNHEEVLPLRGSQAVEQRA